MRSYLASQNKKWKKLICFARCYKRLSFVTLTFQKVIRRIAVNILRKFVDNAKEKWKLPIHLQLKDKLKWFFQGEYSFSHDTNKYWKIENGGITG
jgi:hypothetical protein